MPRTRVPRCVRIAVATLAAVAVVAPLTACGSSPDLTIYSGRNEQLVGGLLEKLEERVGGTVEVRYGGSAELAAQLLEEGTGTEADVFFSQDAGALGALDEANRLEPLPPAALDAVPAAYRADDGSWVATSARSRVLFYDPRQVPEADLPATLDAVTDPRWRGKIGYAPTNASWQAFVTGVRVLRGEDGARAWLQAFAANQPVRFDNNIQILDAVNAGQIALGLSNHYYWYERVAEVGEQAVPARVHYVPGGDPLGLVNVAGAGVVAGTAQQEMARRAVEFLVSPEAQQYFADETAEYPVRAGVTSTRHTLQPLDQLQPPDIDLSDLASLQQSLTLLQETGLA
ncbi:iron ABC transporter substrate-binding protein [Pseudonocardia sp. NPDC049154]|uniref:iron ABC transporter substrate-binding protein n=1 Tax=Pseudonocardia sp. NPDC049154 TaxID=3155501 RepID=UPI0033D63563